MRKPRVSTFSSSRLVDLISIILLFPHLGSFDLDVSGNLRPSPTLSGVSRHSRNSSKLAALHQALHGKEVYRRNNIIYLSNITNIIFDAG
jgi:hypothetical protein